MSELAAAILAAGLSAVLSAVLLSRHERRQMKMDTLRRLFAARSRAISDRYLHVLNEVQIVFASDAEVVRAVRAVLADSSEANQTRLFREMAEAVGIAHENLTDDDITTIAT